MSLMEEARERRAAQAAADAPIEQPSMAKRKRPMVNTGRRDALVPTMSGGSSVNWPIVAGAAAVVLAVIGLLAIGRPVPMGSTAVPTAKILPSPAPAEQAQPAAPAQPVAPPITQPTPGQEPKGFIEPVNTPPAGVPAAPAPAPAPAYAPPPPAAPAAPPPPVVISDLIPIPTVPPAPTNGVWSCAEASAARPCRGDARP